MRGTCGFGHTWALAGWRFPPAVHQDLAAHVGAELQPFLLGAEAVGALLLLRVWLAARRGVSPRGPAA